MSANTTPFADLNLVEHPEGGRFAEYYRSAATVTTARGERPAGTAIYYSLNPSEISAFHRLAHDELWCWHAGGVIRLHIIAPDGSYRTVDLGEGKGAEQYATTVHAGCWFGAECFQAPTLVSAIVVPGFDFLDFELASRSTLLKEFPHLSTIVERLTAQEYHSPTHRNNTEDS